MFATLLNHQQTIDDLRRMIHQADAVRASQLLVDTCKQFPLLAGVVTLLRQGSIDDAINSVAFFSPDLAAELKEHRSTIEAIAAELRRQGQSAGQQPPAA